MMIGRQRLVFACLVVCLSVPVPSLAAGSVDEAKQLIKEGSYAIALEQLREAAKARPEDIEVLFFLGLTAVALSERSGTEPDQREALLDEAIISFHRVLVVAPNWHRVRLEFAYALFLRGHDDLAESHFDRVMAGGVPPHIAANVQRVLLQMRSRRRWSGYVAFSIAPDTNINAATERENIELFGLPFTLSETARSTSGVGVLFRGGGEYQHPLADSWRWRFGLDGVRHEYSNSQFDQTYAAIRTGPRYLLSRRAELSVQAVFGRRWLASTPYNDEVGLRIDPVWHVNRRLMLRGLLFFRDQRHRRVNRLDGVYTHYSLEGRYLLTPTLSLNASVSLSRDRPEDVGSRNIRRRFRIGSDTAFPGGWTVGGDVEWEGVDYEGADLFVPGLRGREDRTRTFRLRLLNRALVLYGFSPQLTALRELRSSNSILSSYQRSRLELTFVRQF